MKHVTKKATKKVPAKKAIVRTGGAKADPNSTYSKRLAARTEETLSPSMKKRRNVFIAEYLVDFCAAQAWRRMKATCDPDDLKQYTARESAEHGYMLTREPYVALKIRETIDLMEEAQFLNRNRILAMALREANYHGQGAQHGGRVSSIKLLADIAELGSAAQAAKRRPTGGGGTGGPGGPRGGVMIVPATADLSTWEKQAKAAQAQLKEDVRK